MSARRLIVFEPDAGLQEVLLEVCQGLGWGVVLVSDDHTFEDALSVPADMVLVDYIPADMLAFKKRTMLAKEKSAPDTLIVGMSSDSRLDLLNQTPIDALMQKPFTLGQLERLLKL
jgi:hypothetical protein